MMELSCQAPAFAHTGMSGKFDAAWAGRSEAPVEKTSARPMAAARIAPPREVSDMDHSRTVPEGTRAPPRRRGGTAGGGVGGRPRPGAGGRGPAPSNGGRHRPAVDGLPIQTPDV